MCLCIFLFLENVSWCWCLQQLKYPIGKKIKDLWAWENICFRRLKPIWRWNPWNPSIPTNHHWGWQWHGAKTDANRGGGGCLCLKWSLMFPEGLECACAFESMYHFNYFIVNLSDFKGVLIQRQLRSVISRWWMWANVWDSDQNV